MRDVESSAVRSLNDFVVPAGGTLGAPGKESCQSVARHRACAQPQETKVMAYGLTVSVYLPLAVVDPCSRSGLGVWCSYG
jgi:hypothetical protein